MTGKEQYNQILKALSSNKLAEAKELINNGLKAQHDDATLYYLLGKVYMKESQWSYAMSNFLKAEELDPQSPARECRMMLNDIMDFYNKDMYNQ